MMAAAEEDQTKGGEMMQIVVDLANIVWMGLGGMIVADDHTQC
jgi:hypothetical protein